MEEIRGSNKTEQSAGSEYPATRRRTRDEKSDSADTRSNCTNSNGSYDNELKMLHEAHQTHDRRTSQGQLLRTANENESQATSLCKHRHQALLLADDLRSTHYNADNNVIHLNAEDNPNSCSTTNYHRGNRQQQTVHTQAKDSICTSPLHRAPRLSSRRLQFSAARTKCPQHPH